MLAGLHNHVNGPYRPAHAGRNLPIPPQAPPLPVRRLPRVKSGLEE
jgi:hypothetical protein